MTKAHYVGLVIGALLFFALTNLRPKTHPDVCETIPAKWDQPCQR